MLLVILYVKVLIVKENRIIYGHKRKPIISRQLMRGFLLWFDRKVTIRLIVIGFLIFGFIYCMFLATFISFFCLYM